jgi:hypothetical protein
MGGKQTLAALSLIYRIDGKLLVRLVKNLGLSLALASFSGPVMAQRTCGPETSNEWLAPAPQGFVGNDVSPEFMLRVTDHLRKAISLLARRSAAPITRADVLSFTGTAAPRHSSKLRPYLVWAIDMRSSTKLYASTENNRLYVLAANLGCPVHAKTPIILFLRQPPKAVFVEEWTAL